MFKKCIEPSIGNIICELCLKIFDSEANFQSHNESCKSLKVHVQEIPTFTQLPMTFESPTNLDPPMPGPIEIKEELIEIKEEVADEFDENTDLFSCPTCQALFKDENKFKIHFERHTAADVYKNQNFTIMETPLEIKDENMDFEIELEKYQVQEKLQEPAVDIVQEIKTIDNDYRKRKLPTSETSALTIKKVKLNPLPKSLNLAQKLLMQQKKPWDAKKTKETLPGKTPEIDIAPNKYPNNYLIQPQKLLKGKVVKLALNGAVKNMNNTVKIFRIARREVPKVVVPAHKILLESPDSEERLSSNIHTRPLEIEFLPDPSERVQIQLPPKIIFPTIETVPEPTNFIEIPAISPEQSSSMKPPILNSNDEHEAPVFCNGCKVLCPNQLLYESHSLICYRKKLNTPTTLSLEQLVNVEPRKRKDSKVSIKKAVELIDLGLSIKTTAKLFGIPKETMQYYMANRQEFAPEQATMFTNEDEMELVEWIVNCSRKGFHRDKDDLLLAAVEKWDKMKMPDDIRIFSSESRYSFFMRHELNLRQVMLRTVECEEIEQLESFHKHMNDYLTKTLKLDINLLKDPKRISNMDSVRLEFNPDVIALRYLKKPQQANVMFTCCADGTFLTPVIIFPQERRDSQDMPEFLYQYHEFSNITPEIFEFYIQKVFHPAMLAKKVEFPVLLLIDDQRLDITWKIFELCKELKIILITMYPRFDKIIQPFEISVSSKFALFWDKFLTKKLGPEFQSCINPTNFGTLLKVFTKKFLDEKHVNLGFRVTGVFPWDVEGIRYEKLIKRCRERVGDEANSTKHSEYYISPQDLEKMKALYPRIEELEASDVEMENGESSSQESENNDDESKENSENEDKSNENSEDESDEDDEPALEAIEEIILEGNHAEMEMEMLPETD